VPWVALASDPSGRRGRYAGSGILVLMPSLPLPVLVANGLLALMFVATTSRKH
jgi:hypothetical protein